MDDLHLLDASSAVLLRQLLDAGVVRLIGTVRSGQTVGDAVDALTGGDRIHRIDLNTFSNDQVEVVLETALGAAIGRRTLRDLCSASGGNVLYLRELVIGALQSKKLACDGEIWELAENTVSATPKLTELVSARLETASEDSRDLMELLALCEPLPLLDAESKVSLESLTHLEDTGVIRVTASRRRTAISLAHPLYGEVLRSHLSALRRRQLLLEQVERTQTYGARRREDPLHIATWLLAATGTADPVQLLQAASLARHAHDFAQVDALLQALPLESHTFDSCRLHGEALAQWLGQWQRGETLLAEAESRARTDYERIAAASLHSWTLFWMGARTAEAMQVHSRAAREITDPQCQLLLKMNEGSMHTFSGRPIQGMTLLEDLEESPPQDQFAMEVWAFAALCRTAALTFTGRSHEAITWGNHAYDSYPATADQVYGVHPVAQLNTLALALTDAGQLDEARRTCERAVATGVAARVPATWVWVALIRGRLEWMAGDAPSARHWYAEVIAQCHAHQLLRPLQLAYGGLAAAASVLGDQEAAQKALDAAESAPPSETFTGEEKLGQAWLLATQGNLAESRSVLRTAARQAHDAGHKTSEILLLTDVARLGAAREVADRIGRLARTSDGPYSSARAHLAAALAADDHDLLQSAATKLEAIGSHLLAAEAATAAATAWRRDGHPRRATAATNLAHQCMTHCSGVLTPLLRTAETAHSLTPRERDIALLAASGTPSKDIASAMHLSVRTVDNHLQRAYTKLGVTTRRELSEILSLRS
ncbi:LuxR C-terminal-related transcriptional regulator [Streptomyces sp900105245]|uniref:LuxR C-terminal-related transcriptional regulator n=1 Tax=Streptomyces sp. 900105245 TaxID=3154379 RepID=A0ABV1ULN2_9ACTN